MANELQEVPDFIKRIAARSVKLFDDARASGRAMPPVVSIKGNRFSLMINGDKRPAPNPIGLDFVVVAVKKPMSRAYYAGKFDSSPDAAHNPPACYSLDSVSPEDDAPEKQSPACRTCKQAEFGSKVDERGKETTACRQHKQLVIKIPGVEGLWLFNIPIASIKKQWALYAAEVEAAGNEEKAKYGYATMTLSTVITRATFDDDVNGVLNFKAVSYIGDPKKFSEADADELDKATLDVENNAEINSMFWGPKGAERRTQYLETTSPRAALPAPKKFDVMTATNEEARKHGYTNHDLGIKEEPPFTPDDYGPPGEPVKAGWSTGSNAAPVVKTKPKPATPPITTTLVQDKDATDMLKSLGLGDIDI